VENAHQEERKSLQTAQEATNAKQVAINATRAATQRVTEVEEAARKSKQHERKVVHAAQYAREALKAALAATNKAKETADNATRVAAERVADAQGAAAKSKQNERNAIQAAQAAAKKAEQAADTATKVAEQRVRDALQAEENVVGQADRRAKQHEQLAIQAARDKAKKAIQIAGSSAALEHAEQKAKNEEHLAILAAQDKAKTATEATQVAINASLVAAQRVKVVEQAAREAKQHEQQAIQRAQEAAKKAAELANNATEVSTVRVQAAEEAEHKAKNEERKAIQGAKRAAQVAHNATVVAALRVKAAEQAQEKAKQDEPDSQAAQALTSSEIMAATKAASKRVKDAEQATKHAKQVEHQAIQAAQDQASAAEIADARKADKATVVAAQRVTDVKQASNKFMEKTRQDEQKSIQAAKDAAKNNAVAEQNKHSAGTATQVQQEKALEASHQFLMTLLAISLGISVVGFSLALCMLPAYRRCTSISNTLDDTSLKASLLEKDKTNLMEQVDQLRRNSLMEQDKINLMQQELIAKRDLLNVANVATNLAEVAADFAAAGASGLLTQPLLSDFTGSPAALPATAPAAACSATARASLSATPAKFPESFIISSPEAASPPTAPASVSEEAQQAMGSVPSIRNRLETESSLESFRNELGLVKKFRMDTEAAGSSSGASRKCSLYTEASPTNKGSLDDGCRAFRLDTEADNRNRVQTEYIRAGSMDAERDRLYSDETSSASSAGSGRGAAPSGSPTLKPLTLRHPYWSRNQEEHLSSSSPTSTEHRKRWSLESTGLPTGKDATSRLRTETEAWSDGKHRSDTEEGKHRSDTEAWSDGQHREDFWSEEISASTRNPEGGSIETDVGMDVGISMTTPRGQASSGSTDVYPAQTRIPDIGKLPLPDSDEAHKQFDMSTPREDRSRETSSADAAATEKPRKATVVSEAVEVLESEAVEREEAAEGSEATRTRSETHSGEVTRTRSDTVF